MSRSSFFFALWCMFVITAFVLAAFSGYSPFADGGRPVFVHGFSAGPQHK
jgi:hypothetical protein